MPDRPYWRFALLPLIGLAVACAKDQAADDSVQILSTPATNPSANRDISSFTAEELLGPTLTETPTTSTFVGERPSVLPSQSPDGVTNPPTIDGKPTATPTPEPTPIPTPVYIEEIDKYCNLRLWTENDIPKSIFSNAFGQFDTIEIVTRSVSGINGPEYTVPPRNIAAAGDSRDGALHIFEHSVDVQSGDYLPFYNLQYLNLGDFISVENQNGEWFCFKVSDFALSGLIENRPGLIGPFKKPTLVAQTSAKGNILDWILEKDLVLSKVGDDKPEDLDQYLVFLVQAEQLMTTN